MVLVWLLRRREEDYFLCLFPWLVFVATLAVRVHYVNQPHNWWLVHPDEIFQSLEVAHSEQYGYGFRPYEFMAPEDDANATLARQVELRHGLYALRSFLLPQAYVTVTWFLRVLGFSFPPFVVFKRGDDPATHAHLSQVAATIAPVHNATVLEHEGDVLVHHGAWARAAERFKAALRVQPDRVSLYAPLVVCYRHLGEEGRSQAVLAECWRRFGAAACQAKRGIVPL